MKVLYDISVLGLGHHNPLCRTGIFRAVEAIASGLATATDCDLHFCASVSFERLQQAIAYLQAHPQFAAVPLDYSRWERLVCDTGFTPVGQALVDLGTALESASGLQRLGLQLLRKPVFTAYRWMAQMNPVSGANLREADIFHSTFYPLPPRVQQQSRIQRFLTLYDLIPLLQPQFFERGESEVIQATLASLTPEDWVLCISESTRQDLQAYCPHLDPSRLFVTPLAASELFYPCTNREQFMAVRQRYHLPDAPYLLSLSTLEPRKNIDHIVRCFGRLIQQEHLSDLYLVLVGNPGWNYDAIFQELAQFGQLRDRVILPGYVADGDLASLYSHALAFVYPSFYEGFGLPPLEAMQCGVPVITSNTSSLPEVVGTAGILLDPRDQDGLCHALLDLYNHTELRKQLAAQSRSQAAQFSWQRCVQQTLDAYRLALTG